MMKGYVNEFGQPLVTITVRGSRGDVTTFAVIDSGFNGDLCLPVQVAIQLGLELRAVQTMELADGTRKRELVFGGIVALGEEEKGADIILTDAQDSLLGTGLLLDSAMEIDFAKRTVEIR
jgi:clan AA aspartic protease